MSRSRLLSIVFLLCTAGLFWACSASKTVTQTQTRLRSVNDYRSVDVDALASSLDGYRKAAEDEVLYRLENGMLNHYRERWDESAKHFQQAERAIERHYTKDISKNLESLLINDLQLPYTGEPYEGIYLTAFNCLNYLHQDDLQGALVEMRQITHKLELLNDRNRGLAESLMKRDTARAAVEKADEKLDDVDLLTENETPPEIQQNSALGRFLTTTLYGKTGSPDDANIELQKLRTALEDQGRLGFLTAHARADGGSPASSDDFFPSTWGQDEWTASDVLSTLFETQYTLTDAGGGASTTADGPSGVSVPDPSQLTQSTAFNTLLLSFTGQAPRKEERSFDIPLIIDEETVQLHFAVPVLKTPESRVDRVRVRVAGDTLRIPMIEDMQAVAHTMFDQKKPIVYTRAVIRSFLKAGATEGAEKAADEELGEGAGFLAEQIGNAMSKGAAQADTRSWQTMPGHAYALAARLPEGTHEVTFEFLSASGQVLNRRTRRVTVEGAADFDVAESIYLK
jgi:hypothetical protein